MTLSIASSSTPMLARQEALAHSLEAARRASRASAEVHDFLNQLASGEPQASGLTVLTHISTTMRCAAEAAKVLGQVSEDNPGRVAQAARDLCVQAALAAGAATRLSCSLASSLGHEGRSPRMTSSALASLPGPWRGQSGRARRVDAGRQSTLLVVQEGAP
jgi:hypothetical protein